MIFRTLAFLGAFLAFWIELAAAKLYLPLFGGSAAVWIVCMNVKSGVGSSVLFSIPALRDREAIEHQPI